MTITRRESRLRQFTLAFAAGLCAMAVPFGAAVLHLAVERRVAPAPVAEVYHPQPGDALTLLAAGREGLDPPGTFVLIRVDPAGGEVALAVVPPETMVEDAGRLDALGGVWRREGPARAAAALGTALDLPIDRWITLSPDGFVELADVVGAVDHRLEEPLKLEDGSVVLEKGRQLLDGRKLRALMSHRGYPGGEARRLALVGELLCEAVEQRLPLMSGPVAEAAFAAAVNAGETNLTIADFESRRRAGAHLRDGLSNVRVVPVTGSYNDAQNTFLLTSESAVALREAFGE